MIHSMRTLLRLSIVLTLAASLFSFQGCKLHKKVSGEASNISDAYYEQINEGADIDWDEIIPLFHHWREISSIDYYFDVPSQKTVDRWRALCEDRNQLESEARRYVQGYYANMNQLMTVTDFYELWYRDESYLQDDDLTTWRLMQYDSLSFIQPDSEFDKFYALKNAIQGLLLYEPQSQWDMNFHAGLECDFQEYYDRVLYREAVRHSDGKLASALKKEQESWLCYHAALESAFRVIDGDPNGMVGSAWPMAISGIAYDNAQMRALSLEDFYFALTDSLDYQFSHKRSVIGQYDIERHSTISNNRVLKEYRNFMGYFEDETFFDPEYSYPVSELRSVLENEMKAWLGWMESRDSVSAILSGLCKDCYDNSTNNVRRHKLIMLKNRYQGFGLTSQFILDCLLPYSCQDAEIESFSFEDKYRSN